MGEGRMFSNPILEKTWDLWAYPEAFIYGFEGKWRIKCPACGKVLESEDRSVLVNKAISHAQEHILCLLAGTEIV